MDERAVRLLGVVLNGGRSRRMGRDKCQLLRADGRTFFEHAYDNLQAICEQVIVSGSRPDPWPPRVPITIECLPDAVAYQGPASGIAASVHYAGATGWEGCLVVPIDTPDLAEHDLRKLVDAYRPHRRMTVALSDRLEPLIAIYPFSLQQDLDALARSEDRGLHRWIQARPHHTVSLNALSCRNVNTFGDLQS